MLDVKIVKNIAKAIVAVIEIFEQGGSYMDLIRIVKVSCKVVGGVVTIILALKD